MLDFKSKKQNKKKYVRKPIEIKSQEELLIIAEY